MLPSEHKQEKDSTDSNIFSATEEQDWNDIPLDLDET